MFDEGKEKENGQNGNTDLIPETESRFAGSSEKHQFVTCLDTHL